MTKTMIPAIISPDKVVTGESGILNAGGVGAAADVAAATGETWPVDPVVVLD